MALVRATHRYARISASKVRPFARMIKGMRAIDGVNALRYVPNRGARMLEKVLRSAIANAAEQQVRNVDNLRIVVADADGGPMMKRVRPRARGMAFLVRSRTSHIHVAIEAPELS
jgi:large subunit ribosomal protein L22